MKLYVVPDDQPRSRTYRAGYLIGVCLLPAVAVALVLLVLWAL